MNLRDLQLIYEGIKVGKNVKILRPSSCVPLSKVYLEKLTIRRTPKKDLINFVEPCIPKKYKPVFNNGTHSENLRIYLDINSDDYPAVLEEIAANLRKSSDVKNVQVLNPHKRFSLKYRTIQFTLGGTVYYIVLTYSKTLSGGMDTDVKEGIIGLLWANGINEPIDVDDIHTCKEVYKILLGGKGISEVEDALSMEGATFRKINTYLKANGPDRHGIRMLNDKISIAAALLNVGYTPENYIFERRDVYDSIRTLCSKISGLPKDKWCPADVFLIKKTYVDDIVEIIGQSEAEHKDSNHALASINNLFVNKWGQQDKPILAISLKEMMAQGGKAMSYLKRYIDVHGYNYHVTEEEKNLSDSDKQKFINKTRNKAKDFVTRHATKMVYQFDSGTKKTDISDMFVSFKVFNYLLAINDPDVFVEIALYSMGISLDNVNPPFFKLTGHIGGSLATVDAHLNTNTIKRLGKMTIIDKDSYAGVRFLINLVINDAKKQIQLAVRAYGKTQATIEIERSRDV